MNNLFLLIFIVILAELFEVYLQKADTFLKVLGRLYGYYYKNIFIFFLVHPSFYIILFISLFTGVLNFIMIIAIALKIFDIFFKLELIKQIFIEKKVPNDLADILMKKVPTIFLFTGLFIYPSLIFYALI